MTRPVPGCTGSRTRSCRTRGAATAAAGSGLQDLLDRARRTRADQTDDELLDRRATGEVVRPLPVRERDPRRLAWTAAAAVLAVVASTVVWTATRNATSDVDVVDAPPAPAETDGPAGFAPGSESTCVGDGEPGFAIGPDGRVLAAEPPPGREITLKEGTRIIGRLSIADVGLTQNRGSFVVTFALQDPAQPPGAEVWHDLWLRSVDGSETGLVRARGTGSDPVSYEILAGPDADRLVPVEGSVAGRTGQSGATTKDMDRIVFTEDALPLLSEPFLWTFEIRQLREGVGDICPSDVDPAAPLADPSVMARFPTDGTSTD